MKLILLSQQFYSDHADHKEIMHKPERPYACLAVRINGYWFAIPFRHNINHKYCYHTLGNAGLDYSKAVVLERKEYISSKTARIEQKEFNLLKGKDSIIQTGMVNYIKVYKKALANKSNPHYANILANSTLQYFEKYI